VGSGRISLTTLITIAPVLGPHDAVEVDVGAPNMKEIAKLAKDLSKHSRDCIRAFYPYVLSTIPSDIDRPSTDDCREYLESILSICRRVDVSARNRVPIDGPLNALEKLLVSRNIDFLDIATCVELASTMESLAHVEQSVAAAIHHRATNPSEKVPTKLKQTLDVIRHEYVECYATTLSPTIGAQLSDLVRLNR
jgi:hypothetical protein